ncbi:hypothetical protein VXM60_07205 [Shewanella khirikhana]|uniref:hypothetical protein n=1 Tax=Shewanella khirikhana TaxID=1965282 RepID=UPI0030CDBFF5
MKTLLVVATLMLVGGCESSQDMFKNRDAGESAETGVRCEMMYRTGSNRKTKVCRTAEQAEADRKEAERMMDKKIRKTGTLSGN